MLAITGSPDATATTKLDVFVYPVGIVLFAARLDSRALIIAAGYFIVKLSTCAQTFVKPVAFAAGPCPDSGQLISQGLLDGFRLSRRFH